MSSFVLTCAQFSCMFVDVAFNCMSTVFVSRRDNHLALHSGAERRRGTLCLLVSINC